MATARFKTFNSSLKNFWFTALPFVGSGSFLIWYGWSEAARLRRLQPHLDASLVAPYWFGVGLGVLVIAVVLLVFLLNSRMSVTIAPEGITCQAGRRQCRMSWRDCYPVFPPAHKTYLRTIVIESGTSSFKIEEFFFPDFALLNEIIYEATQKERSTRAAKA